MACTTPQTSSTKESTNYARLCRLLVDIGTQALRDQFNGIHPPGELHKVLAKNKHLLEDLKKKKIIYLAQWDKLFPSDPNSVSSETFDISLLTVLFRNICGLIKPSKGWNNLPPESDASPAADIARVKYYRNTVYAHAERTSVDEAEFNQYWSDIRNALVRLGGLKYKADIDNLETKCMDPEVEDHYKELLSQWKKDEEKVKDQLNELGSELKNVAKRLDDLSKIERPEPVEPPPLDHYCKDCKVCISSNEIQSKHTGHITEDKRQAAKKQKLVIKEALRKMEEKIRDSKTNIEEEEERLKRCQRDIETTRETVKKTVEPLIQTLQDHKKDMENNLKDIEEDAKSDHKKRRKLLSESLESLKSKAQELRDTLSRNNDDDILETCQCVDEYCKDLCDDDKSHPYQPALNVRYEKNEEEIQRVKRAVLGRVVTGNDSTTVYSVAEGKGLQEAEVRRESYLEILTQNLDKKQVYNADDKITVEIRTPLREDLSTNIENRENGSYTVSYIPNCDGQHEVSIAVNGKPLPDSPWCVHVTPHQYKIVSQSAFGSTGKAKGEFDGPCDIAINEQTGEVAVADTKNNRVQLFSPDGKYTKEIGKSGCGGKELNSPNSVGFTKSGDIVIIASGEIYFFRNNDDSLTKSSQKHTKDPRFLSVSGDGNLIVCDWSDNKVHVLSPDGTKSIIKPFKDRQVNDPPWFAINHQEKFFVCYGLNHVVKVFNKDGVFKYSIGGMGFGDGQMSYPTGITIDKFDNLIVCDPSNHRLLVFTLDGKFVNSVVGLECPGTLAASSTGQLFVTDFTQNCIHVLQ